MRPFDLVRPISSWQSILTPGQHQRLSLARALLHQPQFLVLDETFLAMGQEEVEIILKEFERRGMAILILDPTGEFKLDIFKYVINL